MSEDTAAQQGIETRVLTDVQDLEIREVTGQPTRLVGYAAKFGATSEDLGGFRERIRPGAFAGSLRSSSGIAALYEHDSTRILGTTANGSLKLSEDDKGLRFELDVVNTSWGRDVLELVRTRTVGGCSFGFVTPKGGDVFTTEGGKTIRELVNVDLREITITSRPAYRAASVSVRVAPDVLRRFAADNSARPLLSKARRTLLTTLLSGHTD